DEALVGDRRRVESAGPDVHRTDLVTPTVARVEVLDQVEDRAVRRERIELERSLELDLPEEPGTAVAIQPEDREPRRGRRGVAGAAVLHEDGRRAIERPTDRQRILADRRQAPMAVEADLGAGLVAEPVVPNDRAGPAGKGRQEVDPVGIGDAERHSKRGVRSIGLDHLQAGYAGT